MTDERKDEIGNLFLLNKKTDKEKLKELEIQEVIFLIYSARYFKEKEAFINDNFDEKIKIFSEVLEEKIRKAEELYIAYDKNTNYPYIDVQDRIWMFSKEEYAKNTEDYYMQQLIMLKMKKVVGEGILQTFAKLHILGINKIVMDNGQYNTEIERDDILPPSDWSNTPKISIPVTNPNLQQGMIKFFQLLYCKSNYEGKEQKLHVLEDNMLSEVIKGRYLIPMKLNEAKSQNPNEEGNILLKKDTIMSIANIIGEDDTAWLPAFTDWMEFEKMYDKNEWSGNIVTYDDLLAFSEKLEGIVINCKGICFKIDNNNKKMIEEFKKERENQKDAVVNKYTVEKNTKAMIGEPKEYPSKMIEAIVEYMKKQKSIKKAYLRLMIKDNEKSYLLVVDFDGNKEEIFQGIANAAQPHLNGLYIDMIGMEAWAKDVVKNVEPFYKKKTFRFF